MNSVAWMLTHAKKAKLGHFKSHLEGIQHLCPRKTKFQNSLVALHRILPHTRDSLYDVRISSPFLNG